MHFKYLLNNMQEIKINFIRGRYRFGYKNLVINFKKKNCWELASTV